MKLRFVFLFPLLTLLGCSASQQFVAVPSSLDRKTVPEQTIEMTAEHFHYTPEELHVKAGTLVTIKLKSIDGTHGFKLGAFGIEDRIEENETKEIQFYAGEKGEYGFRCSHFCGIGHLGMTGKVIVE